MSLSIRSLFRRVRVKAEPSDGDHRLAQRLIDRGIAAETSGDTQGALRHYRRAVAADDRYARAHMNLGIALQAAGDYASALASYSRAIEVDSEYAPAHYNLALAQSLRGHYSEAEAEFRAALRLRNDFPEAWVGLAGALEAAGRNEDALSALEKAIALRHDYVGALLNSIALLDKMGRLEAAVANRRRVLELEPDNYQVQSALGMKLQLMGELSEAETSYRLALSFNPDYFEAKANLALILQRAGRNQEAIPLLFDVLAIEPADMQLRRTLTDALECFALSAPGEKERNLLLSLCTDDGVAILKLTSSIVSVIKGSAGFRALQANARRREDPFTSIVPEVATFLREPLLLAALPRMPISDIAVEQVMTHLRRCILLRFRLESGLGTADSKVPTEFLCGLARQCFFSEYIYPADEIELERMARMREVLQDGLREAIARPQALEPWLAIVSLYGPLHTLKGCERLLDHPITDWSDAFRPIVQEQVENRMREEEIARQLPSLTSIDNEISRAVRAQYEENPYPRWVTVQSPKAESVEELSRRLRPHQKVRERSRPTPILIAGCGTGYVPITFAKGYPDSEILAVDLSLASLAYAARMTQQFGISNITFRQADILKMGDLHQRFAVIECSGVLHHLDDPMAGWRVLVKLLESDGLMRISLYSEKARAGITAAREFARSPEYPVTPEGIRRCRQAIIKLPEGHPARKVLSCGDFYTLDGCRDLMMHVQEHLFTLPRIEGCLNQLGLQFLNLESTTETQKRFREMFTESDVAPTLAAWHQFEEVYPDTFFGMYTFWCCRKQKELGA